MFYKCFFVTLWWHCFSWLHITVINSVAESNLERVCFRLRGSSWTEAKTGTRGRNLGEGTEAETLEECCSFICLLYNPEPTDQGQQHPQQAETPLKILNFPGFPKGRHDGHIIWVGGPVFPADSSLCPFDIKQSKTKNPWVLVSQGRRHGPQPCCLLHWMS